MSEYQSQKRLINHLIVLDESGSMQMHKSMILRSVNHSIRAIRSLAMNSVDEHRITLITFGGSCIKTRYLNLDPVVVNPLHDSEYKPSGRSLLFDVLGQSIGLMRFCHLQSRLSAHVNVTILSDFKDSISQKYGLSSCQILIGALRDQGWNFSAIGFGQGFEDRASALGIYNHCTMKTKATPLASEVVLKRLIRQKLVQEAPFVQTDMVEAA